MDDRTKQKALASMPSQVLTDLNLCSRLGSEGQESIIKVSISVESDAGEGSYSRDLPYCTSTPN